MRFGYFDDVRREYVITTPHTPHPWINYLGSEAFFSLISHQAGGYCFYRDARVRRILRHRYNNVPADMGGRYFYVRDGDDYWTPSYMPVKSPLEVFECRHGLGYTRITGVRNGLKAETLFLVPLGKDAEVHQVTLTNLSGERKEISLFSFVEFCLWNAWDDQTNFQRNLSTGEVEVDGAMLIHKTEYRERRNHFLAGDEKNRRLPASGCTLDEFLESWIRLQVQRRQHVWSTCRQSPSFHCCVNSPALDILEATRRRYSDTSLLSAFHDRSRDWVLRIHLDSCRQTQSVVGRDSLHRREVDDAVLAQGQGAGLVEHD